MARGQAKSKPKRTRQQAQRDPSAAKRPRGIEKPLQAVRKSVRLRRDYQQVGPNPALPSPSASSASAQKASPISSQAVDSQEQTSRFLPVSSTDKTKQTCFQNGYEPTRNLDRKRKRSQSAEDLAPQHRDTSIEKRKRTSFAVGDPVDKEKAKGPNSEQPSDIEYWAETGEWPTSFFKRGYGMSQQLNKKRPASAMSYAQSVREGSNPASHSPEYERKVLVPAGIILDQQLGEAAVSADCKALCTTLTNAVYKPPENSLFEGDLFWEVMNSIRSRNEPRVVRDIWQYITPSAEHLKLRRVSNIAYLREEVQTEWNRCDSIAGPTPKPDLTVGLDINVFTDDEIGKFKNYGTFQKPTEVLESLYFPFFTCEAKCGTSGLEYADRQNARNASTAVNAILQLYREVEKSCPDTGFESGAIQFHRKILAFSISHDHVAVKIYGHYALIDGNKTTFHRHLLRHFSLIDNDGENRWQAYNFVRKLYDHFGPIHLKRIRDAVTVLPKPTVQSIVDREAGSQIPDSQEMAPPPQSTVGSKWTRLTATSMLSVLQRQLEDQKRESENQKRESKEELERQRLEYNQRVEQMNSQLNALIRQMQASEQQIRKLTDTISILAPHSQEARNK